MYLKNITAHVLFLLELILNSLNYCANSCCRILSFKIKCLVLFKSFERRLYTIFTDVLQQCQCAKRTRIQF